MYKAFLWSMFCLLSALSCVSQAHARMFDQTAILEQPESTNMCAITFDDGPTPYTAQLLDALQLLDVKATFFVLGRQVAVRPKLVKRIAAEGHEVATHGYSHGNMHKLKAAARIADLDKGLELLHGLGIRPRYFRPPYGKYDAKLVDLAQERGMSVVLWTSDSRDWQRSAVSRTIAAVMASCPLPVDRMRGIFLFHDTKLNTVRNIAYIVQSLRNAGCRKFVTVSEYLDATSIERRPPLVAGRVEEGPVSSEGVAVVAPVSGNLASPDETPKEEPARFSNYASPAGTAPVPLARSSRPWQTLLLLRGS